MRRFWMAVAVCGLANLAFGTEQAFIALCENPAPEMAATIGSLKKVAAGVFTGKAIDCRTAATKLNQTKSLTMRGQTYEYLTVTDLKPFATLDALESLDIDQQRAAVDLAPLASTRLKHLSIQNAGFKNLAGLDGIQTLESVQITVDNYTDLTPLLRLPVLKKISLTAEEKALETTNPYELNIGELGKVPSLREVSFGVPNYVGPRFRFKGLSNLSLVEAMTLGSAIVDANDLRLLKLKSLTIYAGSLASPEVIGDIQTLRQLTLYRVGLNNIDFLSNLAELKDLGLTENRISDIKALAPLKKLETLNLGRNQISYVRELNDLIELRSLNLWDNRILDVDVTNLTKLESLNVSSNQLYTIRFHWRAAYSKLTEIDLSGNHLSAGGIGFVAANLPGLKTLDVSDNRLSAVDKFAGITSLAILNLDNNKIGDVSSLRTLVNLKSLSARGNVLRDPLVCPVQPQTVCDFLHQD